MLPQFPEATANDYVEVDERIEALSQKWLTPNMGSITVGLGKLRARVDGHFEAQKAAALKEKATFLSEMKDIYKYPYGHCDVIRNLVWDNIHISLKGRGAYARYFTALKPFLAKGGVFRKIWGDLTYGPYFQSAMQLGSYYVDVSNDTVVISKPKLDIKYLKDASLRNVDGFQHYYDVAQSYFKWDVYPNIYLPELKYLYPAVAVHQNTGALLLCGVAKPLFYKNLNTAGALAEQFLSNSPYSAKRLSADHEARIFAFREKLLPKIFSAATRKNPTFGQDLTVAQDTHTLRNWLLAGHSLDSCRQVAIRIEAVANQISSLLRPFSLGQL